MTTIVNNPPPSDSSGGGVGMIIGLIVLVVAIALFFIYGLPMLQQVKLGSPQIIIPEKIDVNINQPQQ